MPSAKILVVDDSADFRGMLRVTLERVGHSVFEASNGREALDEFARVHPDLVLVDMSMPVMSGAEFVEELHRRGQARPFGVVAVSGSIDARSSPTPWFLAKPVQLSLLLGVVAEFCGQGPMAHFWGGDHERLSRAVGTVGTRRLSR
jgi:CheY-like chemotaxis protein